MQQYLDLLQTIKDNGTYKPPAREGMPGTQSLFGYQFRHNLQDGFPLLTTKKMYWKGIVTELLWFLRGDTNIKYLVDNRVNIWNQDAYNYYRKLRDKHVSNKTAKVHFDNFVKIVKEKGGQEHSRIPDYKWGDCGFQYGRVWRKWDGGPIWDEPEANLEVGGWKTIDQITNIVTSLQNSPQSRRHIVTAIDPAHQNDLALYWCHAMFQFNCRPLSATERTRYCEHDFTFETDEETNKIADEQNAPKYYLDCQLYQRSADVFLGVPFNIASYALLTHIIAKMCNMIPGDFIHTFGDVHIYDNHREQVDEQLTRTPNKLPQLEIKLHDYGFKLDKIKQWLPSDFEIKEYNPQQPIKGKLSTGLKT